MKPVYPRGLGSAATGVLDVELACIEASYPYSGSKDLDVVLAQIRRGKIATQIFVALVPSIDKKMTIEDLAKNCVDYASTFLKVLDSTK